MAKKRDNQSDGKKTDLTSAGGGGAKGVPAAGPAGGYGGIGLDATRIQYQTGNQGFSTGIVRGDGADWFGPLNPLNPVAPAEVQGRRLDFPSGFNIEINPRANEAIKFPDLRALADGYDVLRLIIETRKDQMERQKWQIVPRTLANGTPAAEMDDPRIQELTDFFCNPDQTGGSDWTVWLRSLLEDMLVIDAASLFRRRTRGGKLFALEQIDGATVKRVIDDWGRTPEPPAPAYQQILKAFPALNYTTSDLLYMPRNVRVHKFYGYSPVEQVIMTVNICLRRQLFQLQYYSEGSMPEGLVGTPAVWTPQQVQEFQDGFDAMLAGNQAMRRRLKFVPGEVGKTFVPLKEPQLTGEMDEWLARIVCFCFSVSAEPFVSKMNRATAETSHDAAMSEGLAPLLNWVKRLIDRVIREDFGYTDLVFGWQDDTESDQKEEMDILTGYVSKGIKKINEVREILGDDPLPEGDELRVLTATGYVKIGVNDDAPTAGEVHQTTQDNLKAGMDQKAEMAQAGMEHESSLSAAQIEAKNGEKPAAGAPGKKEVGKSALPFVLQKARRGRVIHLTHSTKAMKLAEKRLTETLAEKFKVLAEQAAHAARRLPAFGKAAGDNPQADDIFNAMDWTILVNATVEELGAVFEDGSKQAIAALEVDVAVGKESPLFAESQAYARARGAELVGMSWEDGVLVPNPEARWSIAADTRLKIRTLVTTAIEEGQSAQDLATLLEAMPAFDKDRAILVARTELIRANNQGHMAAYREAGVTEKEWSSGEDELVCPECQDNVDQGPIPIDEPFLSGDTEAPAHPNCRCVVLPVIADHAPIDEGDGADEDFAA